MSFIAILVALFDGAKVISPVVLAVLSGVGMILTKTLGWGISEGFQILALIFSGFSFAGLKSAVAEVSSLAQSVGGAVEGAGTGQNTGTSTGTEQGTSTGTGHGKGKGTEQGTGTSTEQGTGTSAEQGTGTVPAAKAE